MKRLLVAAILAAVVSGPAAAQMVGTYSGTSADGNPVSFTVGTDPNTSTLAITGFGVNATANCGDGTVLLFGTGFGGLNQDIGANRRVSFDNGFAYATINFSLKFSADGQSATGTIVSDSPTLSPIGPRPKKASFCQSASQSLGVTFQGAAKVAPSKSGATSYFYAAPR
ncbi:MAG: hypothetical protein ACR2F8_00500 [Caulobacteraceae bacterium]